MKAKDILAPKFFKLIPNSYDNYGGVLYAPDNRPYPIAEDAVEVKDWQSLVVELRGGFYRPFSMCIGGANLVSAELKEVLEQYIDDKETVEFLPVLAVSEKYGNRPYYILHFKKIYDVIDPKTTVYVEGTDAIIKVRLDYEKVKNLHVFNTQPIINDVIVSADVRRSIRSSKLDLGLLFTPVYCGFQVEYALQQDLEQ